MRIYYTWLILFVVSIATNPWVSAANIADFADYSLRIPSGEVALPGRLFTPPEAIADPMVERPLMIYLHGGGARGTDNVTQVEQTPDYMLDEAKLRGAYLYVPQTNDTWASTAMVDLVMLMISRTISEKSVDSHRLYATGYSNGGGGTWSLLSRYPRRFAAALTLAGIIPAPGFNPANLLGTAILTFHARDDATIPVARTRTVVNGILAAVGEPSPNYAAAASDQTFLVSNPHIDFHRLVADSYPPGAAVKHFISRSDLDLLYIDSPYGGHTGLFGVFYAPEVYEWMFSHSLAVPEPPTLLLGICTLLVFRLKRSHV